MSWFKKLASVTFAPADTHRVSQPKTIFYIGYMLLQWARQNMSEELLLDVSEPIAMDGFETHEMTGVVNWYVDKEMDMDLIEPYIQRAIKAELEPLGISVSHIQKDKSGMFDANVWRIHISGNETSEQQSIPELNVANRNAMVLLRILGMEEEYVGEIGAEELKQRIDRSVGGRIDYSFLYSLPQQEIENEPDPADWWKQEEESEGGPKMIDMGLSPDQIKHYLQQLSVIVDYAIKLNNPKISWA